jgi:hypothetical protein
MKIAFVLAAAAVTLGSTPASGQTHSFSSKTEIIIRPLAWDGEATVHAGGRTIDLGVRTRITADGQVVSVTWPLAQGESAKRKMLITKTGGWTERDGVREPMPAAQLAHERQQYGFYTQLQMALAVANQSARSKPLILPVGGLTDTVFEFDYNGHVVAARNVVAAPEAGGKPIRQTFLLSGDVSSNGLHWPKTIRILQNDKLFFELRIKAFVAGAVR